MLKRADIEAQKKQKQELYTNTENTDVHPLTNKHTNTRIHMHTHTLQITTNLGLLLLVDFPAVLAYLWQNLRYFQLNKLQLDYTVPPPSLCINEDVPSC